MLIPFIHRHTVGERSPLSCCVLVVSGRMHRVKMKCKALCVTDASTPARNDILRAVSSCCSTLPSVCACLCVCVYVYVRVCVLCVCV